MHGFRISLLAGLACTLRGAGVGGLVGLRSGYLGGKPRPGRDGALLAEHVD